MPLPHTRRAPLAAALLAIAVPVCAAAERTELEPVVVSATRSAQSGNPTGSSITVITRADIEASGVARIQDLLRTVAGVQISDLYGDGSRVQLSVRGFGDTSGSNVLVLVDGRRLNNPDIAPPELTTIALKNIERIEVIQGSAGVLYGDQAVGGVVNIITRTPHEPVAEISATAGSYATRDLSAHLAGAIGQDTRYRLVAEGRESDNYRARNELQYGNYFGRLDQAWQSGAVFAELQRVDEDINLPGGLFRAEYDADRRQPRFPTDFADSQTDVQRLGMRQSLATDWVIEAELANRDADVVGRLTDTAFTQNRRVTELTPRVIGNVATGLGDVQLTSGVDLSQSDYAITSTFGVTENTQHAESVYAQASVPWPARSTLTLGARYARVANDLRDSFTYPDGIELDDDVTVGSLGWSMPVDEALRVFARVDQNYRFPKVDELTATLGGIVGLKTQTGVSYETGAQWHRAGRDLKAVIYRLDLENEIDFDTTTFANVNFDPTRRDGLLLDGQWRAPGGTTLRGQYARVHGSFRSGPFQGNRVPLVSDNLASVSVDMPIAGKWYLLVEARYVDDRVAGGDIANALERLDGYSLANLGLSYRRESFTTVLRVNNVTDRQYADYAAASFNAATFNNETAFYAAPERNYGVTVQYQF